MIDIDYRKVPQFLQERKKLHEEWAKKYKALKLKQIEMAEDKNFLECEKQLEELKQSKEGSEKTFFGGYSSKQINQLQNLLKLFRKEQLHIVDLGKSLVQYVQYDIPGIQKQRMIIEQQIQSTQQRIVDLKLQVNENKENYDKYCQKLGIKGENIEEEVPQMIQQIPDILDRIEQFSKDNQILLKSIDFYRRFREYMHSPDQVIISLEEFIMNGNVKTELNNQDWEIIQEDKSEEIDWSKYMQPQQITIPDCQLLNTQFRNKLIIDLNEVVYYIYYQLLYFYVSRISIMQSDQNNAILDVYTQGNTDLFELSIQELEDYKQEIEILLDHLNNPKLRQLLILKDSVKQQQRIIQQLLDFQEQTNRCQSNIQQNQYRIEDLIQEKQKLRQEFSELEFKVVEMKEYIEKELTELFKHEIKINI